MLTPIVAGAVCMALFMAVMLKWPDQRALTLRQKVWVLRIGATVGPILEEGFYRWLPLHLWGFWPFVAFSAFWVLMHRRIQWPYITSFGVVLCALWLNGYGHLAIALHYGVNVSACLAMLATDREVREAVFSSNLRELSSAKGEVYLCQR